MLLMREDSNEYTELYVKCDVNSKEIEKNVSKEKGRVESNIRKKRTIQ